MMQSWIDETLTVVGTIESFKPNALLLKRMLELLPKNRCTAAELQSALACNGIS